MASKIAKGAGRKPTPPEQKQRCSKCSNELRLSNFYKTRSKLFPDGVVNICKNCMLKMVDYNYMDSIYELLQLMDIPFIKKYWVSVQDNPNPFGNYMRLANSRFNEFRTWTFKDSVYEWDGDEIPFEERREKGQTIVTDDVIEFFGNGFTEEEYEAMSRKYNFLKNNYPEKTNMHIEALKTFVRYKVKEEFAIARDKVSEAEKWGRLAQSAATSAKINPSQLTAADLSDGLSTFGQLTRAVEQSVDVIDILPRFKQMPHDTVDFTILCYVNYIRNLQGLPLCEYKDVYEFYDARKAQYAPHTDIFENDRTEQNRASVAKFMESEQERELPSAFEEDGDDE